MKAERTWRTISLLAALSVALIASAAQAQYSGGSGTADDPYQIATASDLITLGKIPQDYDKHFVLTADIDLDPNLPGRKIFWAAVIAPDDEDVASGPYQGTPFSGVFDGNGHTISRFHARGGDFVGLFGQLAPEGHLCNLGVEDVEILVWDDYYLTGGLVAWNNGGTISNCHMSGNIKAGSYVGGLVGVHEFGSIRNCYSNVVVEGVSTVGGLAGWSYYGKVWECQSAGSISGEGSRFGGLIGENHIGTVWNCSSTVNLAVDGSYVGGLIGINNRDGLLVNCHSNGAVVGTRIVGGLVGFNGGGIVSMCSSQGSVAGDNDVGGLVGWSTEFGDPPYRRSGVWLSKCCSSASVVGNEGVGGLVAANYGGILNCYSCGPVSGQSEVGGLTGSNGADYSNLVSAFWDIQSSGQATSASGTGLTTAQMQDPNTYRAAGWDLAASWWDGTADVWHMPTGGGYPLLAALSGYVPPQLQGRGTPDEPYLLHSAEELGAMCHYAPWAHYRLANTIDLSGIQWGTSLVMPFTGVFDGNDLSISGLTIAGTAYLGLIGSLEEGAEVRDLCLVDVTIAGSASYIGGVAGWNCGDISDCSVSGAILGHNCAGGLVGWSHPDGAIRNCRNTGIIRGTSSIGGIAGSNAGLTLGCDNTGSISGVGGIGGLVGEGGSTSVIWGCQNAGAVTGNDDVGGMAGSVTGTIQSCHNTGVITGINNVGGLAGSNDGSVLMSSNGGSIAATGKFSGGLVGANANYWGGQSSAFVFSCFNCGSVDGYVAVGGLVGSSDNWAVISDSYNRAPVVVSYGVGGGLVGDFRGGDILNCYNTGRVTIGASYLGGPTGGGAPYGRHTNFWDVITCGLTEYPGGMGLETAQMQTAAPFLEAGWDFIGETANGTEDIWWIDEGNDYPRLWWELDAENESD